MKGIKDKNFEQALQALKIGYTIMREGWNGKGLYINIRKNIKGLKPFFAIYNIAKDESNTWVPSVSDLLAEDWVIIDAED